METFRKTEALAVTNFIFHSPIQKSAVFPRIPRKFQLPNILSLPRMIATNWLAAYAQMTGGGSALPTPPALAPANTLPASTPAPAPAAGSASQQLVSLTSPTARGANATLTVRTTPGASCSITVRYKSGPSSAKGLGPITAGADGTCSWTWSVGPSTTPGTWSITVQTGAVVQTYPFTVR